MGQLEPQTIFRWECDGCGKKRDAPEGEIPRGFSGDAIRIEDAHAKITDDGFFTWYACTPRCIGPAVRKLLDVPLTGSSAD